MKLKRTAILLMLMLFVLCLGVLTACDDDCLHTTTVDDVTKAPTCTESGLKNVICKDCLAVIATDVTVSATGHSTEKTEVVTQQPTCTQQGSKDILCQTCEQVVESVVIPATGHPTPPITTEVVTKQPTCTQKGSKDIICTQCNEVVATEQIDLVAHNFGEWTVTIAPSTTYDGLRTQSCQVCSTPNSEAIPALDQTNYTYQVTVEPTCKDMGKATYTSSDYGTFEVSLPKSQTHSGTTRENVTLQPTCTEQGSKQIVCTLCNAVLQTVDIPANGHNFQNATWVLTTAPTLTTAGVAEQKCNNCNHKNVKNDVAILTDTSVWTRDVSHKDFVSATHTTKGLDVYTSIYGVVTVVTEKLADHEYNNSAWELTTAPTLTTVGVAQRKCDGCDHVDVKNDVAVLTDSSVWTKATDHADAKEPTCTAQGLDVYSSIYGTATMVLPKIPHVESQTPVVVTPATCTTNGSQNIVCSVCQQTISTQVIHAKGHGATAIQTTDATCTADGLTKIICVDCEQQISSTVIPAKGHGETRSQTIEATCTTDGSVVTICNDCNAVVGTQTIPATGHSDLTEEQVTLAPTCLQEGSKNILCSICKTVLSAESISATGHAYGEWILQTAPTTTKQGAFKQVCENGCGLDNTKAIPVLNDVDYTVVHTDSTCAVAGTDVYSSDEHGTYTVTLPTLEHTFNDEKDGYCAVCDNKYYSTGIKYQLSDDGTYYVIPSGQHYITESNGEIIIPAYYNGLPVKEIAGEAFVDKSWIRSVVIPETVEKIGAGAFNGTGLTDIYYNAINCADFNGRNWVFIQDDATVQITLHIGAKVERIPARMFYPLAIDPTYAPNLVNIIFAENGALTTIGDYAFYLTNITNVVLPDTVQTVGNYAFAYTKLSNFALGANVTAVGNNAFMGCTSLTNFVFNSNLESLGNDCFSNCKLLQNADLSKTKVQTLGVDAFKLCQSLKTVILPDCLVKIDESAFEGCLLLENVNLGANVEYVGKNAFKDCSSLQQITIPQKVTFVGSGAFQNCTSLAVINFNATNCADFEQGNMIFANLCASGVVVNVGDNVERIPARMLFATSDASQLAKVKTLVIGSNVTHIGDYAFLAVEVELATFNGTQTQWQQVVIGVDNDGIANIVMGGNA